MSSIQSNASEDTIKLDYIGLPVSHIAQPFPNVHGDLDTKSVGSKSIGSRTSKLTYSEYPQVRPTNPLYSSTFTIRTLSSAVSMHRAQQRDWRWFAVLCIFLFPPTGLIGYGLARKAQIKCKDGFLDESRKLNKRALILCIISVICGVALLLGFFYGFDSWPRSNG